jgi:SAM-dependent methyltransferase
MSWFMAGIYDWFMRDLERACGDAWRKELLGGLDGAEVLEIGAGTGRNLEHYPRLGRLVLAEPDPHMRKTLEPRVSARAPEIAPDATIVTYGAESLDAPDASFDVVVSTLVLCSVGDVARSLSEMRRVLRPGGKLVFLEHVGAEDPKRRAWQRRIEPVWRPLAGNCHLCRDTKRSIEDAGFSLETFVAEDALKALPIIRSTIRGVARR